jgi:hypothetical protein
MASVQARCEECGCYFCRQLLGTKVSMELWLKLHPGYLDEPLIARKFAPFREGPCIYCGVLTETELWAVYRDGAWKAARAGPLEDGKWVPVCGPGEGCQA